MMIRMGLLCDYFLASSDEIAAAVVESGPGRVVPPLAVVDGCGVEPTVQLGTLEELLTGRSYDEIAAREDEPLVAVLDDGERVVERLPDELVTALAAASDERLAEVAVPWSQTEEFWGQSSPDALTGLLCELAALARSATDGGQRLYCWVCV
jgi:hypothetical protein